MRRRGRIKTVHIRKMRRARIQPIPVDAQMPVIPYLYPFTRQHRQPFYIIIILFLDGRAPRGKDGDLPALRLPEIVAHAIHQQMISGGHFHPNDVLALVKHMIRLPGQRSACFQRLFSAIRRKPDGMRHAIDPQRLLDINQHMHRRINGIQRPIRERHQMYVPVSREPFLDAIPTSGNDQIVP